MEERSFGKVKLNTKEYETFLFSESYLYPTGPNGFYLASQLGPFFEVARTKLKNLLLQVPRDGKPICDYSDEVFLREYTLVGHGNTGTNKAGNITGWSGDMLCHSWGEKDDEKGGIEQAIEHAKTIKPSNFDLCFVSDLPRAIHHALMLNGNRELNDCLESFSSRVSGEIGRNGNIVDLQIYKDLISLTLENGFIPTPFLRSHYYGPLELRPAELNEKDREKWISNAVAIAKGQGLDDDEARKESALLAEALMHRKEFFYAPTDDDGHLLTEKRFHLVDRIASFYDEVNEVSIGRKVLVIGSTGCFDASKAYFRNFGQRNKQLRIENDPTERGRVLNAKLGKFREPEKPGESEKPELVPYYLNNPELLESARHDSLDSAHNQRSASLDELISLRKDKKAIIPVELLGFKKSERGKYESYRVSIADVFKSDEPTLFLGNFGQGKSTAAVELTDMLNNDEQDDVKKLQLDPEYNYVAVFVTAKDINDGLHNNMRGTEDENKSTILKLLSRGVQSLPVSLKEECKFVFIIDALDEVHNYRKEVLGVARDKLKEYGKVIITSRFTDFSEHENPGFVTLQLDPQSVIRNMDNYLKLRIADSSGKTDTNRLNVFKEFLMRQDDGVRSNYLLVSFLTGLYNNEPDDLGDLKGTLSEGEILIKGIQAALWDHKATKRPEMPQKPSKDASRSVRDEYKAKRLEALSPWMGFLKRAAAYMAIHNTSSITRKGLEEVLDEKWTVSGYLSKKSEHGS